MTKYIKLINIVLSFLVNVENVKHICTLNRIDRCSSEMGGSLSDHQKRGLYVCAVKNGGNTCGPKAIRERITPSGYFYAFPYNLNQLIILS